MSLEYRRRVPATIFCIGYAAVICQTIYRIYRDRKK
jgi:hypothetical protein